MRQLKIATQITNRDSQAVEKYLQEISKISMITPEEETTLAQRIKMGDQRALDKLVQANLRFVVSVAKQYQHQGLSLSDLINEGNLGLIKAAQRFDETKGFKFISYAVWWIRQSILQALAEQGRLVRLPQNKIGTYNKANKAYMAFEQEHERDDGDCETLPRCPRCDALMRPGVVWFGEALPARETERVENYLQRDSCGIVIVVGTTATFGYIIHWALRASHLGGQLIEVNPEETPLSRFATQLVRERAAVALPRIVDQIARS